MRAHRLGRFGQWLVETRFVVSVRKPREGEDAEVEDGPELRRDVDVHGTHPPTARAEAASRTTDYGLRTTDKKVRPGPPHLRRAPTDREPRGP